MKVRILRQNAWNIKIILSLSNIFSTCNTELIPSPTSSTSRISPDHYSWQLEKMSRQDLIKRLIHLETERALQDTMSHKSESNDMSYQTNRQAVSKLETYREASRELLDRHNSVEYDQNVKVCLWQGCNESFDSLDLLIAHVRNIHIGRGKVRPDFILKMSLSGKKNCLL